MGFKGWLVVILLIMLAGAVAASYAEYRFKYNLYELIAEKIFRRKLSQ